MTPKRMGRGGPFLGTVISAHSSSPGILADGYIQFIFEEKGPKDKSTESEVGDDENVVIFRSGQQNAFEAIREAIEQKMIGRTGPRQASNFDELVRLSELVDRKIITEDEFNQKKKQILGL